MSIKVLPSMEHTFSIKVEGSNTRQMFEGTFTYKRPNRRTKAEIAKTEARLNEDLKNLDEDTKFMNSLLAQLKHTLIKTPEWWLKSDLGYELYDDNVTLEIYAACSKFEKEWMDKVWSEPEEKKDEKLLKDK